MSLRILGSKTIRLGVSESGALVVEPVARSLNYRVTPEVMVFAKVAVNRDWKPTDADAGYPISDLMSEDIAVPAGHFLILFGSEPGSVWLTEFAHG